MLQDINMEGSIFPKTRGSAQVTWYSCQAQETRLLALAMSVGGHQNMFLLTYFSWETEPGFNSVWISATNYEAVGLKMN